MEHRDAKGIGILATASLLLGIVAAASSSDAAADETTRAATGRVTYVTLFNGTEAPEEGRIILECDSAIARISSVESGKPLPQAPRESRTIDFAVGRVYQSAEFRDGSRCTVVTDFGALPMLEPAEGRAEILGYPCRCARTVVRSNQIEVWYTTAAGLRGSPSGQFIVPDGLVLRIVRNGNHEILAREVDTNWVPEINLAIQDWGKLVDLPEYRLRTAEAFVTTVPIFDREVIRFVAGSDDSAGDAETTRTKRFASGTVILRMVDLPSVSDDAAVFAELVHRSNGDAYDRTGSVFLIPTDRRLSLLDGLRDGIAALPSFGGSEGRIYQGIVATPDYLPPVELVRFITPFGVGFFNKEVTVRGLTWADSVLYRQDLTELLPILRGKVWIGAFIGNYDSGGHELSLRLRYYPGSRQISEDPPQKAWVLPLFDTVNRMEMAGQEYARIFEHDTLSVDFEVPEGVSGCVLRYISTGHGGWGKGDEFNPRMNRVFLDGKLAGTATPWRSDCGTYRALNPASGNFWNGLSSSDFSRSGWCPGAAVSPTLIALDELRPGRHRLQIVIPAGAPEGSSFSSWNVSGILLGEY